MPKGSGVVPPPPPSSSSGAAAAAAAVVDDEDYMNQEPEGMFHTYSNQKELLEQVHTLYIVHENKVRSKSRRAILCWLALISIMYHDDE